MRKGGFSVVKLIHSNNIPYALKIINIFNKKFKNNIKNIDIIKNEININNSLIHPNIVQIYNSYELDEFFLLQLEYKDDKIQKIIRNFVRLCYYKHY